MRACLKSGHPTSLAQRRLTCSDTASTAFSSCMLASGIELALSVQAAANSKPRVGQIHCSATPLDKRHRREASEASRPGAEGQRPGRLTADTECALNLEPPIYADRWQSGAAAAAALCNTHKHRFASLMTTFSRSPLAIINRYHCVGLHRSAEVTPASYVAMLRLL